MNINDIKSLICSLAFDMAKDEAYRENLCQSDDEIIDNSDSEMSCYYEWFQPIFDRWYDYFYEEFYKHLWK